MGQYNINVIPPFRRKIKTILIFTCLNGRRNGKKHGVECVKINERAEVKQKKGAGLRKEIKGLWGMCLHAEVESALESEKWYVCDSCSIISALGSILKTYVWTLCPYKRLRSFIWLCPCSCSNNFSLAYFSRHIWSFSFHLYILPSVLSQVLNWSSLMGRTSPEAHSASAFPCWHEKYRVLC